MPTCCQLPPSEFISKSVEFNETTLDEMACSASSALAETRRSTVETALAADCDEIMKQVQRIAAVAAANAALAGRMSLLLEAPSCGQVRPNWTSAASDAGRTKAWQVPRKGWGSFGLGFFRSRRSVVRLGWGEHDNHPEVFGDLHEAIRASG
jgi:hypothetical protein